MKLLNGTVSPIKVICSLTRLHMVYRNEQGSTWSWTE